MDEIKITLFYMYINCLLGTMNSTHVFFNDSVHQKLVVYIYHCLFYLLCKMPFLPTIHLYQGQWLEATLIITLTVCCKLVVKCVLSTNVFKTL